MLVSQSSHSFLTIVLGHLGKFRRILYLFTIFLSILQETIKNIQDILGYSSRNLIERSTETICPKASRTKTNFTLFKDPWDQIPSQKF